MSNQQTNVRRLLFALTLTGTFMIVEVVGGLLSGSLALLADAGHMLTDTMALSLAVLAFRVSSRPADSKRTYGYQRFQVLAAFVNGLALIGIVGWICLEAIRRLMDPPEVIGGMMLAVAIAGLVVNIAAFVVLHGGDRDNMNMRGAALHVLGDLLGSVAAILASTVIIVSGWMPIDPILSLLVAALIFRSALGLVRRSAHILLEGAPEWLDVAAMRTTLTDAVPSVVDIHHVHVWGLTPSDLMLTMHLELDDACANPTETVRSVKIVLRDTFGISHSTIEVETGECSDA